MPRLGAHMSVAGGLPRAVERAVVHRCEALQIFAKNANQWRGREVGRAEVREFRARVRAAGISAVVSHASYLINLATSLPALRRQSIEAMGDEIDRAEALGLLGVVLHPGCYTTGSEAEGLELIGDALAGAAARARAAAGRWFSSSTPPGRARRSAPRFEQLAAIIARMDGHRRVGVCLDTCHLIASGYDICSPEGYASTFTAVRAAGRVRAAEGVSPQRLEEAARQPRRSPRAHRPRAASASSPSAASSTIRGFAICRCCSRRRRKKAARPTKIEIDRFDDRNLNTLRGLISYSTQRTPRTQR